MQGRMILIQKNGLNINISSLRTGLYQLRITTSNGFKVKTISKIK
tara:strand:+ start:149 stop:283 length:135 start_codon:yes stop_codon:yes gene_type:complete